MMEREIKVPMEFNAGMKKYEPDMEKLSEDLHDEILIRKITSKKEFSRLPETDVEMAFNRFDKRNISDEEKVKLTRELLHKVFSSFTSSKLLSPKNKTAEWILRKHLSTRERLPYYNEIYPRILKDFGKKVSIIDLAAGVNGFSYDFLKNVSEKAEYFAIESIGQLVDLTNNYFVKEKIPGKAIQMSLFDLTEVKETISKTNKPRIVFLFKAIDSLEMIENNYSLKLIKEITPFSDLIVVSFAVESMIKRKKFRANRTWITDFIENNFHIKDEFEIGGEKYICFAKK